MFQRAVAEPRLWQGRKFDCRVYLLFAPNGRVYCHRRALLRRCRAKYEAKATRRAVQLTNVAQGADTLDAGQWAPWSSLFPAVCQLAARLASAAAAHRTPHCFLLAGADVMFTAQLRPQLLEVNRLPELRPDGAVVHGRCVAAVRSWRCMQRWLVSGSPKRAMLLDLDGLVHGGVLGGWVPCGE